MFQNTGTCRFGDRCRFSHQRPCELPVSATRRLGFDASKVSADRAHELRDREVQTLTRLFPHKKVVADCTFEVEVKSTDPDWPFPICSVLMHIEFPDDYPLSAMKIFVPETCPLPRALRNFINQSCKDWLQKRTSNCGSRGTVELCLRPFLKWFQREMLNMFIAGLRRERLICNAKAQGITCVIPGSLKKPSGENSRNDSIDDRSADPAESTKLDKGKSGNQSFSPIAVVDENLEIRESTGNSDSQGTSRPQCSVFSDDSSPSLPEIESDKQSVSASDVANQMKLSADQLEVRFAELDTSESFGTMTAQKLCFVFQCTHCKTKLECLLADGVQFSTTCQKCHTEVLARFCACCIHRHSFLLGYVAISGLAIFDLVLPNSSFKLSCFECGDEQRVTGFNVNHPESRWCSRCHAKINIQLACLKFKHANKAIDLERKPGEKSKVKQRTEQIIVKEEGKPLPDFGTCSHYKKSFRWFRFPCCKKIYPCDLCHEKNEDHEMTLANRVICGFCSKEQAYGVGKACTFCGGSFTKMNTEHWEGGRGCRNHATMSAKDKQKFAGMSKTVSRRAQNQNQIKKSHKA
ncbi:unnamed protein product [Soboliphyme baturini]|uniref:C3H1-type domain-containing protein n=1 Tax=Soboliphyme baturini TaxID=241478 RepID=A0A183IUW0_9BILA|nr:unnamed protein product [Soboliphyme baturini]